MSRKISSIASNPSRSRKHLLPAILILFSILAIATGWGFVNQASNPRLQQPPEMRLQGAGATFPYPIYQKWFSEYKKSNRGVIFDYESIGSIGGVKQITEKTIDF